MHAGLCSLYSCTLLSMTGTYLAIAAKPDEINWVSASCKCRISDATSLYSGFAPRLPSLDTLENKTPTWRESVYRPAYRTYLLGLDYSFCSIRSHIRVPDC